MAGWGDAIGAIGTGGSSIWIMVLIIIGVGLGLVILGFAGWWWYIKKRWNLKAEIKLTRSDGNLTNAEWGKAYFNAKRGVCMVKRPGMMQRPVPVMIFDIRKYIQGDNIVTFIQVGPTEYKPVLNNSWEEYEDDKPMRDEKGNIIKDKDGNPIHESCSIMNIRVDDLKDKAWMESWKQAAKTAYSLKTFFTQFQTPIAIAIVIIAVFVGFAMVWTRLGSICG